MLSARAREAVDDLQALPMEHVALPEQGFVHYFCTSLLADPHQPTVATVGGGSAASTAEWIERWGKMKGERDACGGWNKLDGRAGVVPKVHL